MNTQVNLIAAIFLIIIFLPIYFLNKTGHTYLKKLKNKFNNIATSNNLKIDQKECWGITCIGIDSAQQKLLYKQGLENDAYTILNLKDFVTCELLIEESHKRENKVITTKLNTLDLKLFGKQNKPSIILNFYDYDNNLVEDFELKRIDKWMSIIKANLKVDGFKKVA